MENDVYDLIIIGGGPGGLSAGIYAGRAELKTLIIEKGAVGGQITDSLDIENYPGNPHISGQELMDKFYSHAKENSSVSFLTTKVTGISVRDDGIRIVETKRKGNFLTKSIIINVGSKPRQLGLPGESEFTGNGVSYCATCDAAFYENKHVFVLGSGNQAIENAILLTKYASKVSVAVMHDQGILDCNEVDRREALNNPKIEFLWNSTLSAIKGTNHVNSVIVKNVLTGEEHEEETDGVFSFVGMIPQTDFLDNLINKDDNGYILVDKNKETNVSGIFAIGDCTQTPLRQVITAASDGAIAEVSVENYLKEVRNLEEIFSNGDKQAIVFYSPYDDDSVNELKNIENKYKDEYNVNLIDITKQKILFNKLNIDSNLAVALYNRKTLNQIINL